jgi:TolB protein
VCYDRIAFSGSKGGKIDIHTIDLDGSGRRQLNFKSGSNESPSWSPDGRHIAFSSNRNDREKIYIICTGGSGEKAIIWKKGNDTDSFLSPYLDYR